MAAHTVIPVGGQYIGLIQRHNTGLQIGTMRLDARTWSCRRQGREHTAAFEAKVLRFVRYDLAQLAQVTGLDAADEGNRRGDFRPQGRSRAQLPVKETTAFGFTLSR